MPLPEMKHIIRSSAGVYANEGVSLSVEQGEIHALLGENRAGRTTLMNILFGIYQADGRGICFEGRNVEFKSPGEAIARGIGMVHRHFSLMEKMTVLGNVMSGLKGEGIIAGRGLAKEKLMGLAAAYSLLVNPGAPVHTFSVEEQQRAEILRALYRNVSLLILDELTGVFTPQEMGNFFEVSKRLRDEDYGIITTTHRLEETMDTSDRVAMLRDGRKVRDLVTKGITPEELSACMIGRGPKTEREIRESVAGEMALSLKDVYLHKRRSTKTSLDHVNLTIRRGEILGITGVEGDGQKELAKMITGIRRIKSGQMGYQGKDIRKGNVKERFRMGVPYISDDRHGDSLVMDMTAEDNLILRGFDRKPFSRKMVLDYGQAEKKAREALDEYSIRTPGESGIKTPVKLISGGSQQKTILSREVPGEADLIVASQPTRGLDTGATRFVYKTLLRQRDAGRYTLLISTDLDKILRVSDRVAVTYESRTTGIPNREEADVHKIGLLMGGIAKEAANEQEIKNV